MATRQTPYRLSDEDRARIAMIRAYYGLSSDAEAVRFAVRRLHRSLDRESGAVPPREGRPDPG